jgi:hypothetical protein
MIPLEVQEAFWPIVQRYVGKQIVRIKRLYYMVEGRRCHEKEGWAALQLEFADGAVLFLDVGRMGDDVAAQPESWSDPLPESVAPEQIEDDWKNGRYVMQDVSHEAGYSEFVGRHIAAIHKVFNRFGELCGVQFDGEGERIVFAAQCDEAYVFLTSQIAEGMRTCQLYLDTPPAADAEEPA